MRKQIALSIAVSALLPGAATAQGVSGDGQAVDSFQMPRPADAVPPRYPAAAARDGKEGWVELNFMVSPEGKAYEIQVLDRVGDEAFVRAAEQAAQESSFSPARVGDRAVDGSLTIIYRFVLEGAQRAASPTFAARYRRFARALNEGSQDEAVAELASLEEAEVHNNYEAAYLSLARFQFAASYGNPLEQMRHLETALGENVAQPEFEGFLPADFVTPSRRSLFQLMVQNQRFAEAEAVFRMMEIRGDEEGLDLLRETHDRLQAFRMTDEPYAVDGQLDENGSWTLGLFKDDFYLDQIAGTVDQIKLRCEREYVFLAFDPETQYTVSPSAGDCLMEVLGAPGTTFTAVQQ